MTRLTGQLSQLLAVDDDLTTGAIRSLALSLRNMQGDPVRFFTAPNNGTGMVGAASTVKLDVPKTREMWRAITKGRLAQWQEQNELEELPGRDGVR